MRREALAEENFGADAPWFLRNIPFLEIDDPEIQQIYYYRWKLFRSHIREIGPERTTVLEFLEDVPWAREPYTDLNDSASFHLAEGRWLRAPAVVDDLIDHLYTGGANDRHFSESIAAATVGTTLVTGDPAPALRHLDTMQHIYNLWDDHLDRKRNLYWIEPLLDATEYTISSIDASGAGFTDTPGKEDSSNGFTGGYAFRPSINSYQYANALAIAHLAELAGEADVAADYKARAEALRVAVLAQLWNAALQHFVDRYQRSTKYVTAGEFIRGRELVGYTPWFYELPPKDAASSKTYGAAWKHVLSSSELAGADGLRTVEPSYPRYTTQYRYDKATGLRECQWNGPSWPFQTSQTLTALANLLNDYPASEIGQADYLHLLRQYTHQHFLSPGHPDLQEDYDPDHGGPIVGLPRSHHYAHSTYIDLILNGLVGVRPRADDVLEINPLLDVNAKNGSLIRYFQLQGLRYHGHDVGVIYDRDGNHYHRGAGLSVYVDGGLVAGPATLGRMLVKLTPVRPKSVLHRVDLAVNPGVADGSVASASSTSPAASLEQGIDGRMWFFPEIANGWSPAASDGTTSWYAVDFGEGRRVGSVELYFFADDKKFRAPDSVRVQYESSKAEWQDVPGQRFAPERPLANGETEVMFPAFAMRKMRVVMHPALGLSLRLIELKAFAPE